MDFDKPTDRRGTNSSKWDAMEKFFGVSPDDGIAMWVADMDFGAPEFLQDAARAEIAKANYSYFCGLESYYDNIAWWMKNRHGWDADPEWMFTTSGLGNAITMLIQTFSEPGERVAIFTPVYHEFTNKINKTGRVVTELPMPINDGIYGLDFEKFDALMQGDERILLISSPHNPAGRVWTKDELKGMADFCERHDLILISDEIHHDLVFTGHRHVPFPVAVPELLQRTIVTTAASKTFNIAGLRTGCVTIPDAKLRERFFSFFNRFDIAPNQFGVALTRAAYTSQGAEWVDGLVAYIESNAQYFNQAMAQIPGVKAMPMEGTYLAWIDFEGCGMSREEIHDRIYRQAKIAATPGHTLGAGGETYMRFNLGTQRAVIENAVARLQDVFSDLQ